MQDIILRDCGAVGWLGIVKDYYGVELYRTGKHHSCCLTALMHVQVWLEGQKC